MFVHYNSAADCIRTYRYKDGVAYLPPNITKLKAVATLLGTDIIDCRSKGLPLSKPFELNPDFTFRPHQVDPAHALLEFTLREKYGVLEADCGCGKTVTMTWVAGQLGSKVLILVDMGSLQTQWQAAFDIVWKRQVQIVERNAKLFDDVAVATFQLLHANPELTLRIRKEYGCLLLDEFHSTASDTRREILMKMDNEYRLGCTATLMKKGYANDVLTDMVSDQRIVMIDESALKADVVFLPTETKFYSENPDDWGKIQSALGKDLARNKLMADLTISLVQQGRKVLTVGVTVGTLKQVAMYLKKSGIKHVLYTGSTTLAQDLALRDKLAHGMIDAILTVRKADKGLDLPALDALVNGRPSNNQSFVEQLSGRIVRRLDGKPTPLIVDLVDKGDLAKRFATNRTRWYQKLGYQLKTSDVFSFM
ncbi:DEAD/DEAH box helicase [Geobacter sp. SVR]|uniref:DEAD/DEAH box helicase n=1 Tax=Geobacter sp. SVR TaxID=2495594 RepID=UPI00143EFC68|nr:DEAD/DEAH box helicase family protein [Geobacter sp. SVR]BCS54100.1 hypothetical protein GSVR_24080 [Geobacter sp. SVR]GCF87583.1 hypothetical protein GSbR_41830 [Geobacter sp. SVR]